MAKSKIKVYMFYPFVAQETVSYVSKVLNSRYVGEGPMVERFEAMLRDNIGTPYLLTVNSGTSAIRLALSLLGVGPGDEVITVAQTSQATNMPILENFARPVFADVRYESCTMDPNDIEHRITDRTKAIVCVDWGGYPCDLDEIMTIAKRHNLPVIEDAAHALGASYKGKKVGTIADATIFSFQAIKHITTGDGGALCLLDENLFRRAIKKRWYGIDKKSRKFSYLGVDPSFDITEVGFKYNMNDIAAAIGIAELRHLDWVLKRRQQIVKIYREELSTVPFIELFESRNDRVSANWLFCMHVKNRYKFAEYMWDNGVEVSVVNWRNDIYTIFGGKRNDLPNTDKIFEDMIAIPLHPRLTDEDVMYVVKAIKTYHG